MKKLLSGSLAVLIMLSAIPFNAVADYEKNAGEMGKYSPFPSESEAQNDGYVVNYDMPDVVPPKNVHPRVYFTEEDIAGILSNAEKEENKVAWESFNRYVEMECDGILKDGKYNGYYLGIIESKAFDCSLRGNTEHGREAADALKNFISTVDISSLDYNNKGQLVYMMGVVYDWCFDILTEEEKEFFQYYIVYLSEINEIKYPEFPYTFSSHSTEGMLLRDLLSASIAVFDERPDVYRNVGGVLFEDYVPGRKFFSEAHMYLQGTGYTHYRQQWNMLATYLMDAIGYPDLFGENQEKMPYWLLYARRPDGHFLLDGDTNWSNQQPGKFLTMPGKYMFLSGNYYKDPYVKEEAIRCGVGKSFTHNLTNQTLSVVEYLIFNDPELKGRKHSELPLSKYFPSPKGGMIARTSWDEGYDSDAVVAEMKINELYSQGHQHYDAGAFQIYYKGNLANDTGYYQSVSSGSTEENTGNSVYWSLHHINYYRRTIAHNAMLIVNPDEAKKSGKYERDGGQGSRASYGEMISSYALYNKEKYRTGYVLGQEFGPDEYEPDYTYIKGDISPAYYGKTENYERNFMFLNLKDEKHPAAMIVMDRVVSKEADYDKVWLLHGISYPEISGSRFTFTDNRKNYSGKLTVDTIYPSKDNLSVNVVGGEGQEFMVNGTNYFTSPVPTGTTDGSGYRLELSTRKDSKEDIFLNVLQVGDTKDASEPLNPEKIEAGDFLGVKLSDRVVLMRTEKERTDKDVTFEFDGDIRYKITVADLKDGTWAVYRNGEYLCDSVVGYNGGVAYFEGQSGAYTLSYKGENYTEAEDLTASGIITDTEALNRKAVNTSSVSLNFQSQKGVDTTAKIWLRYKGNPNGIRITADGISADTSEFMTSDAYVWKKAEVQVAEDKSIPIRISGIENMTLDAVAIYRNSDNPSKNPELNVSGDTTCTVVFEAEQGEYNSSYTGTETYIMKGDAQSNGFYIHSNKEDTKDYRAYSPRTEYDIRYNCNVGYAGDYNVWIKYKPGDVYAKSMHVSANNIKYPAQYGKSLSASDKQTDWAWVKITDIPVRLNKGDNIIAFIFRKRGIMIDSVAVTNDENFNGTDIINSPPVTELQNAQTLLQAETLCSSGIVTDGRALGSKAVKTSSVSTEFISQKGFNETAKIWVRYKGNPKEMKITADGIEADVSEFVPTNSYLWKKAEVPVAAVKEIPVEITGINDVILDAVIIYRYSNNPATVTSYNVGIPANEIIPDNMEMTANPAYIVNNGPAHLIETGSGKRVVGDFAIISGKFKTVKNSAVTEYGVAISEWEDFGDFSLYKADNNKNGVFGVLFWGDGIKSKPCYARSYVKYKDSYNLEYYSYGNIVSIGRQD